MFLLFVLYHLRFLEFFYGSEIRHGIFLSFAPIRLSLLLEIRSTPPRPPGNLRPEA